MLVIILVILFVDAIIFAIIRKNINFLLFSGLCGSLIVMLTGIIIYIAKIGGLSDTQYQFLFLSTRVQTRIQYLIITLDKLGYMIAVGRYLSPAFLLMIALRYSTIPFLLRHREWTGLIFLLPAFSLVLYYPQVFYVIVCNRFTFQAALMSSMLVWILVYLALAVGLMFREYFTIPIAYFRRQYRNIFFLVVSLAFLYGIYCFQDPIQVYQLYGSEYLWVSGFSYSNPSMPLAGWILLTGVTILTSFLGLWNLIRYTQVNYQSDLEDIVLQRKFDISSAGVSTFVHSIKNQILACGVVHKRIRKILEQDSPDIQALKDNMDLLGRLNEDMLAHMDRLYASTKSNSITLKPVTVDQIAKLSVRYFQEKYPAGSIGLSLETNGVVLADRENLSEAICNLLTNAQEAIQNANRQEKGSILLHVYNWRIYTIFEIRDNGSGIPKNEQKRIFDPFYTTKNSNYNWGMGLHYVKRIAQSHFGILRFESTPGEGTSFFLMLPRYDSDIKKRIFSKSNSHGGDPVSPMKF